MSLTQPEPNYDKSIEFLKRWGGLRVLVAIDPNKKGIDAASFDLEVHERECHEWLKKWGRSRNLYFTVNAVSRALDKKPNRQHVISVPWLHVDLDPEDHPGGAKFDALAPEAQERERAKHFKAEQERIFHVLVDPTHLGIPKPTVITFSGGGYQAFWKLRRPILLDGSEEAYEDAKLYNKQLELLLGGDNCHNVDRIMRIPGTVNRPDPRKRKKGRTEELAALVEWDDERVYDLKEFTKAPVVQDANAGFSGHTVKVSGNVRRLSSVTDLPKEVSDRAKVVIVNGLDPDDPLRHPSRSEWLFYACCELVRADVDDDTIFSVITDPNFKVSESVLEKGSGSEAYAIRQIARAREEAVDPRLRELNDEYAFVEEVGGRARIMSFYRDAVLNQEDVVFTLPSGFKLAKNNRLVEIGNSRTGQPITVPMGTWWISHPLRRSYDRVVFAPGHNLPSGTFNLWQGFGVEPRPGECGLFLEHLRANVCGGVGEHFDYLLRWMASAVQYPGDQGHVAIVLRGPKGVGKSFFATQFGKLWGRHFKHITNPDHLVGKFNAMLMDGALVFADEAFYAGNARHAQALKTLITEDRITVELKGVDMKNWPNCTKLIMASNEEWIVRATRDERRFFVLDVGAARMQDRAYFSRIVEELEGGGYAALLDLLLGLNLSEFDVTAMPKTEALREQVKQTLTADPRAEWLLALLTDGVLPNRVKGERRAAYSTETRSGAGDGLYEHARRVSPELRNKSNVYLSRGPGKVGAKNIKPNGAGRFWRFPPLAEARAAYDDVYGAQDWPGDAQDDWVQDREPYDYEAQVALG